MTSILYHPYKIVFVLPCNNCSVLHIYFFFKLTDKDKYYHSIGNWKKFNDYSFNVLISRLG